MTHPNRARDAGSWVEAAGYCTDERHKVGYRSRRDARKMVRKNSNLRGLNAYLCEVCKFWHLGHLPRQVKAGELDRAELKRIALRKAKRFAERQERDDPLGWRP